jgi:hypothetical protein
MAAEIHTLQSNTKYDRMNKKRFRKATERSLIILVPPGARRRAKAGRAGFNRRDEG